jgi:DNA-binding transcriptional MerR regulator
MKALNSKEKTISPSGITKKYNISYQTVNYYTNLGLLTVKKRKGNSRLYDQKEVGIRLSRIAALKDKGYPLRLIMEMFDNKKRRFI